MKLKLKHIRRWCRLALQRQSVEMAAAFQSWRDTGRMGHYSEKGGDIKNVLNLAHSRKKALCLKCPRFRRP